MIGEINERVYSLACCGTFQLTDHPKSLTRIFDTPESMAYVDTPDHYYEAFLHYLNHPEERTPFIISGMKKTFESHTIFHRMDKLVQYIEKQIV